MSHTNNAGKQAKHQYKERDYLQKELSKEANM